MAVSAAPLSPLPPVSPSLLSPLPVLVPRSVIPRAESHEVENACQDSDIQNGHCAGGFSFHVSDSEGIKERDTDGVNDSGIEQSEAGIQSAEDFDLDVDPSENLDVERRSTYSIYNRSPTPYPQNVNEDEDQDSNGPDNFDENASIASFSGFSGDEEEFSSPTSDVPDTERAEKRSVEIDGQSERHGGRTYITETESTKFKVKYVEIMTSMLVQSHVCVGRR
ncbi:hypothetical protein Golomagni_04113 [Golovinomyces magnicellulatus]|nr:hypothetical protein Golomagni_04113 [Golovinomyces magnicellulatus]